MRLDHLIAAIGLHAPPDAAGIDVADVADDSRAVVPGALFIARKGPAADGSAFLRDAARAGAVAALIDEHAQLPDLPPIPVLRSPDTALHTALLAERFFGEPSAHLAVVGVTGTNGKTTVSCLLRDLLAAHPTLGPAGLISTVAIDDGAGRRKNALTTPGAIEVSRSLAAMRRAGMRSAVLETSSHALDQRRVAAVRYRLAVFTNLTGDHLDYHGDMDAYAAAKARLFEMLPPDGVAVVNADDPWSERMLRDCPARVIACSAGAQAVRGGGTRWTNARVTVAASDVSGSTLELLGPWGRALVRTGLIGAHNAMNCLEAFAAAHALGAPPDALQRALESAAAPPGRLERVPPARPDLPAVFVDYAHTDDALTRALAAARPLVAPGARLRVVFGCGGDRDRTKRPRMGAVCARLADDLYVTSDNPRTEDPRSIIDMILAGLTPAQRGGAAVDPDRAAAIARAVADAHPGDVVLIAGKGHEDYQILPDGLGGTVRRHFDDREEAAAALRRRAATLAPAHAGGRP